MAYVVLDLETTGLDRQKDTIIEVGAVRFENPRSFSLSAAREDLQILVNPGRRLPKPVADLTGITDEELESSPGWEEVRTSVQRFLDPPVTHFVAHNVNFEVSFLEGHGISLEHLIPLDTFDLAYMLLPRARRLGLEALCAQLQIDPVRSHRAHSDALATAQVFARLCEKAESLPDRALQLIASHLPERSAGFSAIWSDLAQARDLQTDDRDMTCRFPHRPEPDRAAASGQAGDQGGERDAPDWDGKLSAVLDQGGSRTLLVSPGPSRLARLGRTVLKWSAAQDRRTLICLPSRINDPDQRLSRSPAGDAASADERISFVSAARTRLDWERLHAWKAGRLLEPQELRLLGRVVAWAHEQADGAGGEPYFSESMDRQSILTMLLQAEDAEGSSDDEGVPMQDPDQWAPVTFMDHGAMVQRLLEDPDFAWDYDAVIVDDSWHLAQNASRFATRTFMLRELEYALDCVAAFQKSSAGHEAAFWLYSLPGLPDFLEQLSSPVDTVRRGRSDFLKRLQELERTERSRAGGNGDFALPLSVEDLQHTPPFVPVQEAWQNLSSDIGAVAAAGERIFETVPNFDEEEQPLQARYVQQLRMFLDSLESVRAGLDSVIAAGPRPGPTGGVPVIPWLELHRDAERSRFNLTRFCGPDFWRSRLLERCDSVVFLQLGRTDSRRDGLPAKRLGIADLPRARLDAASPGQGELLLVNPQGQGEPNSRQFATEVGGRWPELALSISGNAVFMLANLGQRGTTGRMLRSDLRNRSVQIVEDEVDEPARIEEAFLSDEPAVLLCTPLSLQSLHWELWEIDCVVLARLPFGTFRGPVLEFEQRRVPGFSSGFRDQSLPTCAYNLMRIADLLALGPGRRTALAILDTRLVTKKDSYGGQLERVLPRGRWTRPPIEKLAPVLAQWLRKG